MDVGLPSSHTETIYSSSLIFSSIALPTTHRKLDHSEYEDLDQFRADLELVFTNAMKFNPPGTAWHQEAKRLLNYLPRLLEPERFQRATPQKKKRKRSAAFSSKKKKKTTKTITSPLLGGVSSLQEGSVVHAASEDALATQASLESSHDPYDGLCCALCSSGEHDESILLCDGCDAGFHMACLTPPLLQVPSGDWFCSFCTSHSPESSSTNATHPQDRLSAVEDTPPRKRTRRSAAAAVQPASESTRTIDAHGGVNYQKDSASHHKDSASHQKDTDEDDGHLSLLTLADGEDDDTMCCACGSGSQPDRLLLCDACDEGAYHLDCLSPPLTEVPSGDWLCPRCAPPPKRRGPGRPRKSEQRTATIPVRARASTPSARTRASSPISASRLRSRSSTSSPLLRSSTSFSAGTPKSNRSIRSYFARV
mmetsp:Transcript_5803/g.14747  ORF Transcript_5803/g.14747 Transcript_5803/m.14747 type:complete len:423 (-) Transcript_5803:484-1752(-)